MITSLAIPPQDLNEFGMLPDAVKTEVMTWMEVLLDFETISNKVAAVEYLSQKYRGRVKVTKSSLYRKRGEFAKQHWRGLVNGSKLKGAARDDSLASNILFIEFWQGLCEDFQRSTFAAYRSLFFDHLRVGKVIPGYSGSWQSIYLEERHGQRLPAECPFYPDRLTPKGWGSRNLYHYAPDVFHLTATRQGMGAASKYLPSVPRSRVGMGVGRFKMVDDVWHDHAVNFAGNSKAYRPLQLGCLDVFSGYYESFGCKPIRELGPKEKEHIRNHYLRALYVHMFCVNGYHKDGCTVLDEHGTAGGDDAVKVSLQRFAPEITFDAGGMQGKPIAKGLFDARPRGNFRWKAALESAHNLHHNELAALPGQLGKDRDHSPAELYGMNKQNEGLIKICVALEDSRPDLMRELAFPYMQFDRFMEFLHLVYERINNRMDHRLEGFEEAGLTVQEYRLDPSMEFLPMEQLMKFPPQARAATEALLASNPGQLTNCRRMTPAEAYHSQKHTLRRLSMAVAPEILGKEFAHSTRVDDRREIVISDPDYKHRKHVFSAHIKTLSGAVLPLDRGRKVLVHLLSPMDVAFAFVSDPDGTFLGAAPGKIRGAAEDMETLQRNLGLRQQALATEIAKLRPHANKKLRQRDCSARHNLDSLGIEDPVEKARLEDEAAEAARRALRTASRDVDADSIFGPDDDADDLASAHAQSLSDLF